MRHLRALRFHLTTDLFIYRRWVAVLALTMGTLVPAIPAGGGTAKISPLRLVSGVNLLPPLVCGSDPDHQDWEQEATLAVNPINPKNFVTAWIQDFEDAIVTAYSTDGGGTWSKNIIVPTNSCTGGLPLLIPGDVVSAADPWLSFGPDGTAYLATSLVELDPTTGPIIGTFTPVAFYVVVNASSDGGQTWSQPAVVDRTGANMDRTTIIADPTQPGYAYVAWDKALDVFFEGATDRPYFSRTIDGGQIWLPPVPIYDPPRGYVAGINQLLVLPDADVTLVAIFGQMSNTPNGFGVTFGATTLMSVRSTDHGLTWSSPPATIATADAALTFSSSGLAPDGTIYIAWKRPEPGGTSFSVMYSKSLDGGVSWQTEKHAGPSEPGPLLAAPTLAIADDGTIGVIFYDHRNDIPGTNPPRVTDLWFRHSHDGGVSWRENHLAGPFDQTTAPSGNSTPGSQDGGFIGDYQGIAPIAGGFVTTFTLAKAIGANGTPNAAGYYANPTDICFAKVNVH